MAPTPTLPACGEGEDRVLPRTHTSVPACGRDSCSPACGGIRGGHMVEQSERDAEEHSWVAPTPALPARGEGATPLLPLRLWQREQGAGGLRAGQDHGILRPYDPLRVFAHSQSKIQNLKSQIPSSP